MKKSEIIAEAKKVKKRFTLETKEDYQKVMAQINDEILPRRIKEGGILKFIWQEVQRLLASEYGKKFKS